MKNSNGRTTGRPARWWIAGWMVVTLYAWPGSSAAAPEPWTPEIFDYDQPDRLEVTDKGPPKDAVPETRQSEWVFRNLRGQEVPLLVTLPTKGKGPFPVVLLVHALGSDRRQISRDLGPSLAAKGFACVAPDLPEHGDRGKHSESLFDTEHAEKTYKNIIGCVQDLRQTLDLIKQRQEFETGHGVPLVGYSLGAWFGTLTAASDRRVSSLVLWCGGAGAPNMTRQTHSLFGPLPGERDLLKRYPMLRAETAIARFAPRPLLMQNGRKDPFISEEHAKNLYRLAQPPKELKWYDAGHVLPEKAATDAAAWIQKQGK